MIKTKLFYGLLCLTTLLGNSCRPSVVPITAPEATDSAMVWRDGESSYLQHILHTPEDQNHRLLSIQGQWIDRNGIGQWSFVFGPLEATDNTSDNILRHFADLRHQWPTLLSPFSEQRHVYWTPQTGWQSGILSTEGTEP